MNKKKSIINIGKVAFFDTIKDIRRQVGKSTKHNVEEIWVLEERSEGALQPSDRGMKAMQMVQDENEKAREENIQDESSMHLLIPIL